MTQQELDREVAKATGENLSEIRRLGFSIADSLDVDFDPEPLDLPPQALDWDEVDPIKNVPVAVSLDELFRRAA